MSEKKLIRYAGADHDTWVKLTPPRVKAAIRADELFGLGKSTIQIAKIMKIKESRALKLVNVGRSIRLNCLSPYLIQGGKN